MKKYLRVVFLVSVLIIIASCAAKKVKTEVAKKDIDKQLVHTLVGSWFADSYDYGNYEITYDDKNLNFNSTQLEIKYTEDNRVFTHQKEDKKLHYIFEVKEEEVIVYPSYEVEQSGDELVVGGDLAPIQLKKEPEISQERILGRWKSTESDYPAFIQVRATFDPNKVELLIAQEENSKEFELISLTFENGGTELNYLNGTKTIRYRFSIYEDGRMIINSSTTQEGVEGTARPWILERAVE
ncbi:hypothetical protein DOK67_0001958 [Enterococcus sp. DIV0212c]|uniref:hypothetical protein n=1 Tax=Enterococcus sp. DIV0212c TaxID=2230867 RepID=UPI001A9AFA4F|nr:hypothetical protein [Enterococcus sp. DIV0212c]MBO1352353.1 hypothetical protein [Enterococcus sp. DIV0212c]